MHHLSSAGLHLSSSTHHSILQMLNFIIPLAQIVLIMASRKKWSLKESQLFIKLKGHCHQIPQSKSTLSLHKKPSLEKQNPILSRRNNNQRHYIKLFKKIGKHCCWFSSYPFLWSRLSAWKFTLLKNNGISKKWSLKIKFNLKRY